MSRAMRRRCAAGEQVARSLRRLEMLCRAMQVGLVFSVVMPGVSLAGTCLGSDSLNGVNVAGAEFTPKRRPGRVGVDYVYPDGADIQALREARFNALRLPVLWERLQPKARHPLEKAELRRLKRAVALAREAGMCVIIDLHNYGAYWDKPVGSKEVPLKEFIDVWKRLASVFGKDNGVAFGLMNEPHRMPIKDWSRAAEATVRELRRRGWRNLILVAGGRWSGAHDWHKKSGGTSNAEALKSFRDSSGRTLIEVHQYADPEFSGTGQECIDPARLKTFLNDVGDWAKKNGHGLFLGEFGTGADPECLEALDAILSSAGKAPWRGWTYWAAGKWLGNYPYSVQSRDGKEAPQMKLLKKHAHRRQRRAS